MSLSRMAPVTDVLLPTTENLTQASVSKMELIYSCKWKVQKSADSRHGWIRGPDKVIMGLFVWISPLSPPILAVISKFRCNKTSRKVVFSALNPLSQKNSKKPRQKSWGISLVIVGSQAHSWMSYCRWKNGKLWRHKLFKNYHVLPHWQNKTTVLDKHLRSLPMNLFWYLQFCFSHNQNLNKVFASCYNALVLNLDMISKTPSISCKHKQLLVQCLT